ncbi:MAG: putative replicase [Cressdnaviricota sp.]|nr:MAG: putative replicase [Cressdnaviricota sp.]
MQQPPVQLMNLRTLRVNECLHDVNASGLTCGYPKSTERLLAQLLADYFDQEEPYLVVREFGKEAQNPHYHLAGTLLNDLPGSKSRSDNGRTEFLRKRVATAGWKGNECQSWKLGVVGLMDSHFDYLCKGTGTGKQDQPQVVFCHPDFTKTVIAERNKVFWKINATLPKKGSQKRKRNASEEILSMCRERNILASEHGKIFDQVLRYYCKHIKYLQPIYVKNLVHQTSIYLNPEGNTAAILKDYCTNNYP